MRMVNSGLKGLKGWAIWSQWVSEGLIYRSSSGEPYGLNESVKGWYTACQVVSHMVSMSQWMVNIPLVKWWAKWSQWVSEGLIYRSSSGEPYGLNESVKGWYTACQVVSHMVSMSQWRVNIPLVKWWAKWSQWVSEGLIYRSSSGEPNGLNESEKGWYTACQVVSHMVSMSQWRVDIPLVKWWAKWSQWVSEGLIYRLSSGEPNGLNESVILLFTSPLGHSDYLSGSKVTWRWAGKKSLKYFKCWFILAWQARPIWFMKLGRAA